LKQAQNSTRASLATTQIIQYLTTVKIGDGAWKGTSHAFVLHYMEQFRLYHSLVSSKKRFSEEQQMIMLQTAVDPLPALSSVRQTAELLWTQQGVYPTLLQYIELLKSAASIYDNRLLTTNRTKLMTPRSRSVYYHDLDSDEIQDHEEDSYDIDSSVQDIVANVHKNSPFSSSDASPRLPFEKWKTLSKEDQQSWIALPVALKCALISPSTPRLPRGPPPSRNIPSGLSRFAQQHDIVMGSDGDVDEFYEVQQEDISPETLQDPPTITAHAAAARKNTPHPGDL